MDGNNGIPDEVPYPSAQRVTEHVDGLGALQRIARADSIMLRTIPPHERARMQGDNLPADHVELNGKAYSVDAVVRRGEDGWTVDVGQWGILSPVGPHIGPGTPSAERKAREALQAWADKYAEDIAEAEGLAQTHAEARYYLTRQARQAAEVLRASLDALDRLDDADLDELPELAHIGHRFLIEDRDR